MNNMKKSINEEFARFFEKPSREGLRELLKNNHGEFSNCDFKGKWPELDKIARHLLGMGNSGGGCLILGVAEMEDKTLYPKGLDTLLDKSDFYNVMPKFLPKNLLENIEIQDYSYDASEYPTLVGKKFQVVFVGFDPKHFPFIATSDGKNIKDNAIYTRRGTSTKEVNHEELQNIINRRLETGYSSQHEMDLETHIQQLKILYRQINKSKYSSGLFDYTMASIFNDEEMEFKDFIIDMTKKKKERIEIELDVDKLNHHSCGCPKS